VSGAPCPACGARAAATARFCVRCGGRLESLRSAARRDRELAGAERAVISIALVVLGTLGIVVATALVEARTPAIDVGLALALGLVALAAARVLGPRGPRESLAAGAGPLALLAGLAGGCASFAIAWSYTGALNALADVERSPTARDALPTLLLTVAVLPALVEEWLCRGVLWAACRRAATVRVTLVVTALVFALLHGLGGGFVLELPHRFAAGLVFGLLRARTGSLLPGIVAHCVHNALALLLG
jgi:sodium transport system permease protein